MTKRQQRLGDINASINDLKNVIENLKDEPSYKKDLTTDDTKWAIRIETSGGNDEWVFPRNMTRKVKK